MGWKRKPGAREVASAAAGGGGGADEEDEEGWVMCRRWLLVAALAAPLGL